jgi:hypothetical protein
MKALFASFAFGFAKLQATFTFAKPKETKRVSFLLIEKKQLKKKRRSLHFAHRSLF